MWWNIAIGGSMLIGSLTSLLSSISNVTMNSINKNNPDYQHSSNYLSQDRTFLRISKYPSKSMIGYGMF